MNVEGNRMHESSASLNDDLGAEKEIHDTDRYVNNTRSFRVVIDEIRSELMPSETAGNTLRVHGAIVLGVPQEGLNKVFLELDCEHVGPVSPKPSDSKQQQLVLFGDEGEISGVPIGESFEFILFGLQPGWLIVSVTAAIGSLKARSEVVNFFVPRGVPGPI